MSPQQSIAHYRITAKLGEGGMGAVYRATDTKLNREVAIKVLPDYFAADPDRLGRFQREAEVLASLNHPNIAAIYGVEERALVLELVEGLTLAERIAQGSIPLEEALPIATQIAEALEYAHERGVVHRDLKPANIKITPQGRVKVLDFGLAKALASEPVAGHPASSPTLTMRATMAGMIMGTDAYMSPEQARGQNVDQRADIWAFGVVLYEMLTGHQLFGGPTVSDTLAAVLRSDPDWSALPGDVPANVRTLLRRCLERDPKRRLPHIGVARIEFDDAVKTPVGPVPPSPVQSRRSWLIAVLGVVALAGIAVSFLHFRESAPQAAVLRFQIPAPENANFGAAGLALSPDGSKLAFIATATGGQPMIWVRSLDSLPARALPTTEGAIYLPFWSPDGRYIGFGVPGKLKKVEASGGPAVTLCDVNGLPLGGTWNRDGVILFSTNSTPVLRVSQAGGTPTDVTKLDAGELAHMRPWFLPDGRHFLYISRGGTQSAIYAGSLDGKKAKRLVVSRQAAAYAPPNPGSEHGHLLFLRENTLMAQPLDTERLELLGEPVPISDQVGSVLAMGYFAVSANGLLAYRSGTNSNFSHVVRFDREGKVTGTFGPSAEYLNVSISPDGRRLALDERDQHGTRDVWLLDLSRDAPTRFTFSGMHTTPIWSPDGSRLVFGSDPSRANNYDIYEKNAGGAGEEHLLLKSGVPQSWSPDGKYLLYAVNDPSTRQDLWILPMAAGEPGGNQPKPFLNSRAYERSGQFSPDGRWVAYASDESGQYQIYVQSFPAGAGKFQISATDGFQPRWRPDGKEIFYVTGEGKLMAVSVNTAPQFEVSPPQMLFDPQIGPGASAVSNFRYAVTPDGRQFLAASSIANPRGTTDAPITILLNWNVTLRR